MSCMKRTNLKTRTLRQSGAFDHKLNSTQTDYPFKNASREVSEALHLIIQKENNEKLSYMNFQKPIL